MSVQSQTSVLTYQGNGSTVTPYPVTFPFLLEIDVKVSVKAQNQDEPVLLENGVDYTLTIFTNTNNVITGGQVVTSVAYDSSFTVFIYRDVALTQLTELPEFGPFPADTLERSLDKATMMVQQLDRALRRCFRTSPFGPELTPPFPRANTVLGIAANLDLRLFTGAELLSLIQLPGSLTDAPTAYWLNDSDRPLKVPDFVGQIGLQMDDNALFRSTGTEAGDWVALVLDEDDMASESAMMPPSQQSVKAYVDTTSALVAVQAAATAEANAIAAAASYTDGKLNGTVSPTFARFTPRDYQAPSSNWARLSTRNGISTLRFSDVTAESACFIDIIPEGLNLSNGVVLRILWSGASATTGKVRWDAYLNRLNGDIDSITELSIGSVSTSTDSTSGVLNVSTITYASGLSVVSGDAFQLRVARDPSHIDDDMTGDAEIIAIELMRRVV